MTNTLNRRGSRSEGRINITVQDRLAETERLKKEFAGKSVVPSISPPKSVFGGIGGVTLVTSNDSTNLKEKLGKVRNSGLMRRPNDFRPRTADPTLSALTTTNNNSTSTNNSSSNNSNDNNCNSNNLNNISSTNGKKFEIRSNSVGQNAVALSCFDSDNVSTKFLTESSTVSIPVSNSQNKIPVVGPPKYKTMPSPTRTSTILPESNCLNEIFEEGTDVGSSDTSATNTPRPITRHSNFTNNRAQGSENSSSQRRSKFHKTRTTSCSSSDDDDSENRKKRAHKIVDSTKPFTPQRRDSHDDSSDSQDTSNGAVAGANSSSQCPIQVIVGSHAQENDHVNQGGDGNTNGRQNKIGFRRHRAGRRRAGETRLRESQSLNRITEVQESEFSLAPLITMHPNDKKPTPSPSTSSYATVVSNNNSKTKMGFGARFFQGFRKTESSNVPASNAESRIPSPQPETKSNGSTDDTHDTSRSRSASRGKVEMALEVELAKALKVTTESKGSSAAKKLKMIGRYFQVNVSPMFLYCLAK